MGVACSSSSSGGGTAKKSSRRRKGVENEDGADFERTHAAPDVPQDCPLYTAMSQQYDDAQPAVRRLTDNGKPVCLLGATGDGGRPFTMNGSTSSNQSNEIQAGRRQPRIRTATSTRSFDDNENSSSTVSKRGNVRFVDRPDARPHLPEDDDEGGEAVGDAMDGRHHYAPLTGHFSRNMENMAIGGGGGMLGRCAVDTVVQNGSIGSETVSSGVINDSEHDEDDGNLAGGEGCLACGPRTRRGSLPKKSPMGILLKTSNLTSHSGSTSEMGGVEGGEEVADGYATAPQRHLAGGGQGRANSFNRVGHRVNSRGSLSDTRSGGSTPHFADQLPSDRDNEEAVFRRVEGLVTRMATVVEMPPAPAQMGGPLSSSLVSPMMVESVASAIAFNDASEAPTMCMSVEWRSGGRGDRSLGQSESTRGA